MKILYKKINAAYNSFNLTHLKYVKSLVKMCSKLTNAILFAGKAMNTIEEYAMLFQNYKTFDLTQRTQ